MKQFFKEDKRKKHGIVMMLISFLLLAAVVGFISRYSFQKERSQKESENIYKYHVAMINDRASDVFWDSVYEGALQKGKESGIYVENFGEHLSEEYSLADLLAMAVSAQVDGIIMQPKDDEEVMKMMEQAANEGIPVITVLSDATESGRRSFVSANDYALGEMYGNQLAEAAKKVSGKGSVKAVLLVDAKPNSTTPNLIYSGIREAIAESDQDIQLDTVLVNDKEQFETEEKVRDLLLDKEARPDILICLSVEDTTSAYQCVIDYNLVGEVQIIGYYTSPEIIEGIKKGIIQSTVVIDADEMGRVAVQGMYEYLTEEYVNEYFTVASDLITKENVSLYDEEQSEDDEK